MVSTFTPNVNIEEPARGDDVGTWDTPVNSNMTLIDLVAGGVATISAAAGSVVLSAAQFRSNNITFNSTLAASITVTFPTTFIKPYSVSHFATGSSVGTITLQTTAAGGQVICVPPGETIDCYNDGTSLRFRNLGRVGSYWDYAGSSVPAWVSGCTVPPWLNCDGSTYNSSVYTALFAILGSSILPDSRGRARAALNQGTGRMTTANGGVDGNTLKAAGGADSVTLATSQIPSHTHTITDPGHAHSFALAQLSGAVSQAQTNGGGTSASQNTNSATTGITVNSAGGGALHTNVQPTYIGGLTLIRAA